MKLVLAGSGTNLFLYVGAYRAFYELYGPPEAVIGTSGGALIGSLICYGYSDPDRLEEKVLELSKKMGKLFRWRDIPLAPWRLLRHGGIIPVERLEEIVSTFIVGSPQIPFYCNVTRLGDKKTVVLSSTSDISIRSAVATSAAFPFVFSTKRIGNTRYTDGGVTSNYMIDFWEQDCVGFRVASDLSKPFTNGFRISEYVGLIISGMMESITQERLEDVPDVKNIELDGGSDNSMNLLLKESEIKKMFSSGYSSASRLM